MHPLNAVETIFYDDQSEPIALLIRRYDRASIDAGIEYSVAVFDMPFLSGAVHARQFEAAFTHFDNRAARTLVSLVGPEYRTIRYYAWDNPGVAF